SPQGGTTPAARQSRFRGVPGPGAGTLKELTDMWQNAWPALVLLALMVGIAWSLKWARGRFPGLAGLPGVPGQQGPALKLLGSLSLGPQQRVVTLQVGEGEQATCLVLGVAPGGVSRLH